MIFKRWMCLLLAVMIFVADSGQTIYAHTCLKSNRTTFALGSSTCCKSEQAKHSALQFSKVTCCKVSITFIKQAFAGNTQYTQEATSSNMHAIAVELFTPYAPLLNNFLSFYNDMPPGFIHRCGNEFTCVFRC